MARYPSLYKQNDDDDDDFENIKDESIRKEAEAKADQLIEKAPISNSSQDSKK